VEINAQLINIVKNKLGSEKITCLHDVFCALNGYPPQLDKRDYRKNHVHQMEVLDELEHSHQLIKCDKTHTHYQIIPYVFLLIDDPKAITILEDMETIFQLFKDVYMEQDITPIAFNEIQERLKINKHRLQIALYYLCETHSIYCGKQNDFPDTDESTITIDERVLRINTVNDLLLQYFRWHYLEPEAKAETSDLLTSLANGSSNVRPDWYDELDDKMAHVVDEIDTAIQVGLRSLTLMGIRALIEALMISCIGDDKKSFRKNLNELCKKGYTTERNADFLYKVIDAGSAVIHRGYIPSDEDVKLCIDMVKNLMEQVYVIHPKLDEMSKRTPQQD
jgi:hypothetical protein